MIIARTPEHRPEGPARRPRWWYYAATIAEFREAGLHTIVGEIAGTSEFPDDPKLKRAWSEELGILQSFVNSKWQNIKKDDRKLYQKNAYRVLLTRARQGMVVVVPPGDRGDPTRAPRFYDQTFEYLRKIGIPVLP